MSIHDKIGKLFMIGLNGPELDESDLKLLDDINPGFVILFKRNVENRNQVKKYISKIHQLCGNETIITADQEGGIVTRLENGFSVSPGAMATTATSDKKNSFICGKILGEEMYDCGITLNLAPVIDINSNSDNPAIGVRSFGNTINDVYDYSEEFIKGLHEAGVGACIKHFPGNGDVNVDPHLDMPFLDKTMEELESFELVPFRKFFSNNIETMMPTHLNLPKIMTENVPVTVSKEILTDLVRNEMGYEGLIISDDLTMGGVKNSMEIEEICYKSLMAGIDVLCICHDHELKQRAFDYLIEKYESDENLKNRIDESVERIETFIKKYSYNPEKNKNLKYEENQIILQNISDKAITYMGKGKIEFPLKSLNEDDFIFSIKPSRQTLAEDSEVGSIVGKYLKDSHPDASLKTFKGNISLESSKELIEGVSGNTCVFISENAYLNEGQRHMIEELGKKFEKFLLIAIRNPYDVDIPGVSEAILSYGYSYPNQLSIIRLLKGEIEPKGVYPIKYTSYREKE